MEQDEVNMSSGVINDDSFSEDETGLSKEEEYPGNHVVKGFRFCYTCQVPRLTRNNLDIKLRR